MSSDDGDFMDDVLALAKNSTPVYPSADYISDGDCVEFFVSGESYKAERVDDLLTVYYGQESKEITGALIKGYKRFVKEFSAKAPGFLLEVEDGPVKISCLFVAGTFARRREPILQAKYRKLSQMAQKNDVEVRVPALS